MNEDRPNQAQVNEALPLTEATFTILLSLATGKKHGYAIMKDVEALSSGRIVFSTGTLYGALRRMLEQDWIERREEADGDSGRSRKTYALSELGRRILAAESARLQRLAAVARVRLSGGPA